MGGVGGVECEPARGAAPHALVEFPGTVQRVLVRIDQDVDGGQLGHGLGSSVKVQSDRDQKMVVQSFFMLTTVQPCSAACVCDASAEVV